MFKFNLNDGVILHQSGETGIVISRSDSNEYGTQYMVRYKAGDGRLVETWWSESALALESAVSSAVTETPGVPMATDDPRFPANPLALATPEPTSVTEADASNTPVDSDGMPWDPEIHTSNKSTNGDGTWKAARGKADEAKAAREAFKSAGGNVTPPDVSEAPAPASVVPAAPAAPAPAAPAPAAPAPAAPAPAAPAPAVADPGYEATVQQIATAFESGKLTVDELGAFYTECGVTNIYEPMGEIQSSEQIRIAIVTKLAAL